MPGLPRQSFEIPLDAGLLTRGDKRAKEAPAAEQLLNAEFDDDGGLRVRFPFGVTTNAIVGGGTLENCRKLACLDDERLCFTSTALYAWVPAESGWVYRGDHLAVMTDEQTVFAQTDDQYSCERAELGGQVVYAWVSAVGGGVMVAAIDKVSGAVTQPPVLIGSLNFYATISTAPKLIALSNCIMILGLNGSKVIASKITLAPFAITDQGNSGNGFVVITVTTSGAGHYYDACKIPGQDRIYVAVNGSGAASGGVSGYTVAELNSTWTGGSATMSRLLAPAFGPIAIAASPDATVATVVRGQQSTTNVYADGWNITTAGSAPTLDATATGTLGTFGTGSVLFQIAASYRLTKDGGYYRCYGFWTLDEADDAVFEHRSNWIDTSGALGTAAAFVYALGLGSRAFAHDSHVYVWGTFAGLSFDATDPTGTHSELQNTYYLYRDDGFLVAKAVLGEGAGLQPRGWLPNVVVEASDADAFTFMGGIRRIVSVGSNTANPVTGVENYAERAPREITFTFDDDRARRCVQAGATLYVTGGLVLQYDGVQLTEVGFATYPWLVTITTGFSGAIAAAGYSYKGTNRWTNAKGDTDRSTTATVANVTLGSTGSMRCALPNLYITRKTGVALEVWRTEGTPTTGVPFFLATGIDPAVTTGDNAYMVSDPTAIAVPYLSDNLVDADLAVNAASPENGGVLSPIEPPAASIIVTDSQRVYLAGIPSYPNTVYYSKYRQDGFVAAFNDALSFETPIAGGAITGIGYIDGTLIVWCATATYAFAGPGFDDLGGGSNFQLARTLSTELGAVSQDAIEFSDDGWYVKTNRGWYLLDRGLNYTYVGAGVYRYDDEPVLAVVAMTTRHQIRVVTPARVLMLDTRVKKWAEWTISDGLDMLLDASGACWYLTPTGPRQEITTWTGYAATDASLALCEIETTWLKPDGRQQGRYVVDYVQLLGEFRSACEIRVQLAKDYEQTAPGAPNWHTDKTWSPFPTIAGNGLELRAAPAIKRCAAIKARITITAPDGTSPLGGPCARLTSLTGQFAVEPGIYGAIAGAQKQ